ncbi:MAG: metallophosphoesterase family protein [Thermoplasmatota archaeon]
MRILHVSDTHVGFNQYTRLTADGLNQREQDFFDAFRAATDHALRERPDVVVHSGDLFDGVRPTNRAVAFVMEQVRRLAESEIPFFVIAGNHDTPRLRETGSVLRCLEFLPNVTAVFRDRTQVQRYGDLALIGVPQASSQEDYESLLDEAKPTDARYNVLVAHAGVVGVAEFRTGEFNELILGRNRLDSAWSYVALGHYHGMTEVAPRAWYAGSTERTSFREVGDVKGCLLWDLATGARKVLPTPTRPMVALPPIDCASLSPLEVGPAIVTAIRNASVAGKMVSLRIRGLTRAAYASLDHAAIRRASEGAVQVGLQWDFVAEQTGTTEAGTAVASLSDEWDAFLSETPLGANRDRVRAAGREILAEVQAT